MTGGFPAFPPGLWRRIVLRPGPGRIDAALEDDLHSFRLHFDHASGQITGVRARAVRTPWTACPGATDFLAGDLAGKALAEVAGRDPAVHCTHLIDLAVLAAAHAGDDAPTQFDMRVADRVEDRTTATLEENGVERLRWQLDGTLIASGPQAGLDLRRLSQWKRDLAARDAERATVLRRAVFISGGRQFAPPAGLKAIDMGPQRQGVCFNYQPPQSQVSERTEGWRRDFSMSGREPLAELDTEADFAVG